MEGGATQDPVIQWFYNILVVLQRRSGNASQRSTILFGDYDILRNVNQTTREVTGISRFQRRIGKTFSCTMGRDEIIQHVQATLEIGKNGVFNDFTARRS